MSTELFVVVATFLISIGVAYRLGGYISKVYKGERTWLDFMRLIERLIYRLCGIDPAQKMDWKQFLKAMLTINLLWFVYAFVLFLFQGKSPLNPDHNPGMTPDLSFNTGIERRAAGPDPEYYE